MTETEYRAVFHLPDCVTTPVKLTHNLWSAIPLGQPDGWLGGVRVQLNGGHRQILIRDGLAYDAIGFELNRNLEKPVGIVETIHGGYLFVIQNPGGGRPWRLNVPTEDVGEMVKHLGLDVSRHGTFADVNPYRQT